jgi:isopentenyldiphosphate isomerase/intracellular septation protein A
MSHLKQAALLKKLLPGFIPLFVFILADEFWGMKVGLVVALLIGLGEMGLVWYREKRLDHFVLLDTALLVALSGISILLENEIFFKLKPALIELILCAILGVSVFSSVDIVGTMTRKYMKGVEMNEFQEALFKKNLRNLFYIVVGHTALVFYSAFYMSKEAWAFISGGLFYILFFIYFGFEFFKNRKIARQNLPESSVSPFENEEWLPVVGEGGKIIGKAPRSLCHKGEKILHPVVHLHVFNHQGHIYLQKRPMQKLVQPGKWDTAVGGHISIGEDLQTALRREAYEEIGLENFSAKPLGSYRWDSDIESELVYYFISYDFQKIRLHSDEVEEGKFWSPAQIEKQMGHNIFTPNFEFEYRLLKKGPGLLRGK